MIHFGKWEKVGIGLLMCSLIHFCNCSARAHHILEAAETRVVAWLRLIVVGVYTCPLEPLFLQGPNGKCSGTRIDVTHLHPQALSAWETLLPIFSNAYIISPVLALSSTNMYSRATLPPCWYVLPSSHQSG
jgi:hypothetical protein